VTVKNLRRAAILLLALLAAALGQALCPAPAAGQTPFLVKDLNTVAGTQDGSSNPAGLTVAGDRLFFTAEEPSSGREPWVTDGTPSGTEMLADICPGLCGSNPQILGGSGGIALFLAVADPEQAHRPFLWRSDGTRQGTAPLSVAGAPFQLSSVEDGLQFAFFGGRLYFGACPQEGSCGFWRTDGTEAGTQLVSGAGFPLAIAAAADRVYFVTADSQSAALWVTRGTAATTSQVVDLHGSRFFTASGSRLFYLASTTDQGEELWTSDGTAAGTRAVTSFEAAGPFENTQGLKPDGAGRVYFSANDVLHGDEIWRSDGTALGTRRVTDFGFYEPFAQPGHSFGLDLAQLEVIGDRVVFLATDGLTSFRAWTSDGTPESTAPLAGVFPDNYQGFFKLGGRILIRGGKQLWSTDGTAAGTATIGQDCACTPSSVLVPRRIGDLAYFLSYDGRTFQLWKTDGTAAGTRRAADTDSGPLIGPADYRPFQLALLGNRLFFNANDGYGNELWSVDARSGGAPRLVANLATGAPGSSPGNLLSLGDKLAFTACDGSQFSRWASAGSAESTVSLGLGFPCGSLPFGYPVEPQAQAGGLGFFRSEGDAVFNQNQIFRTDGTPAGTFPVATFPGGTFLTGFAALGNRLFFLAVQPQGTAVWTSDGTVAGTAKAFDAPPTSVLLALGGGLAFESSAGNTTTVWTSDGTAAGTRQLAAIPDSLPDQPLSRLGSALLFLVHSRISFDVELWRTDGTAADTLRLSENDFRQDNASPEPAVELGGALYFFAATGFRSRGLWRTDGTPAGTRLVHDFRRGSEVNRTPPAAFLTVFAGRLYFAADDGVSGRELWTSDGTADGTVLLRDLLPGKGGSGPAFLTIAGGRLYFAANDGLHGAELWVSDGTAAGTRLAADLAPEGASSYPDQLTVAGSYLYFTADDGLHGRELWALPLAGPAGCRAGDTRLCLAGQRFQVEIAWKDFQGRQGVGHAVSLTADTGYFWFFDPANVETVVKVLDAQALDHAFWVFYGALSNVEYTMTVTDTQTGLSRRYFNPSGQLASVGDTHGFGPLGAYNTQAAPATVVSPPATPPLVAGRTDPRAATGVCTPGAQRLCLGGGRFAVTATWKDFSGKTGTGTAVALTADTGYFWFFAPTNVEVILKVLDGRALTGKFWFFYGALSNVEYTLTVTDTQTGAVKTYKNPSGQFGSVADTGAF
jgi:ELWxxDGT repeat protein